MQKPKNLPETPGVYQFRDNSGNIIYIGKAKNLKNRLNSYFANQLLPKTAQMVANATNLTYINVNSEFEALLLEANLIKKYKPKYNVALKDDKSPLYIGITKDKYPRIISFRKPEMDTLNLREYFGPFLTGYSSKRVLRLIRKVFPYSTHLPTEKICIYRQLGLCNPCPSEVENESDPIKKLELRKKYLRNVRNVKKILTGKFTTLQKDLNNELKESIKDERFEDAKEISNELKTFEYVAENREYGIEEYLENPNLAEDLRQEELDDLFRILSNNGLTSLRQGYGRRVECFDIAHLSGSFPTASMVTFIDGVAEKKYYRHFKIYQKKSNSDVDSMREVITRRLKHLDPPSRDASARQGWGRPDLIIIDGGKPQLSAIHVLLENPPGGEASIPFIGLAKRFETIVVYKDGKFVERIADGPALNLLQRIRDEAHRFARRLHHKQVRKELFDKS